MFGISQDILTVRCLKIYDAGRCGPRIHVEMNKKKKLKIEVYYVERSTRQGPEATNTVIYTIFSKSIVF